MISDFYKNLGKKLDVNPELLKCIDDHIFYELQEHMKDPQKWAFLINKYIVFEPKYWALKKYVENNEKKEDLGKAQKERVEKYKKILILGDEHMKQQKINGKLRQNKKETDNE